MHPLMAIPAAQVCKHLGAISERKHADVPVYFDLVRAYFDSTWPFVDENGMKNGFSRALITLCEERIVEVPARGR